MDKTNNPKKKAKKNYTVEDIFKPGKSIEVVFDIDSFAPIVRSSIIYECNYTASQMIISQAQPQILPSFSQKQVDITALVEEELGRKFRSGIKCKIAKFLKEYRLARDNISSAILIKYTPELKKVNIRSAFRLEPNEKYKVEAKLLFDGNHFDSGRDLTIRNISFSGIGLLIPRRLKEKKNKLLEITKDSEVNMELNLIEKIEEEKKIVITSNIDIIRIHPQFNSKSGFLGAKFTSLSTKEEETLSKFIHDAQMYIIRKSNRL